MCICFLWFVSFSSTSDLLVFHTFMVTWFWGSSKSPDFRFLDGLGRTTPTVGVPTRHAAVCVDGTPRGSRTRRGTTGRRDGRSFCGGRRSAEWRRVTALGRWRRPSTTKNTSSKTASCDAGLWWSKGCLLVVRKHPCRSYSGPWTKGILIVCALVVPVRSCSIAACFEEVPSVLFASFKN